MQIVHKPESMMAMAAPTSSSAPTDKPPYAPGDSLILAAPAHTGLPTGANVIVNKVHPRRPAAAASGEGSGAANNDDNDDWHFAVTLVAGGKSGSDVRYIKSVRASWLRSAHRIATAKACAPQQFGTFLRLASHLIVPLFQRRYVWGEAEWRRLFQDIATPRPHVSALMPHSVGRVVIARADDSAAIVIVDGQQRCTTMMLLLCALRDAARSISSVATPAAAAAAAATTTVPIPFARQCEVFASQLDRILLSKATAKRLQHAAAAASTTTQQTPAAEKEAEGDEEAAANDGRLLLSRTVQQAQVGLESLPNAAAVRFVPSRDDRLPFCSLILGARYDADATGGARKMTACYQFFRGAIAEQFARVEANAAVEQGLEDAVEEDDNNVRPMPPSSDDTFASAKLSALQSLSETALKAISVVVFELQDGVALQNMYDMLAQRERMLLKLFSDVPGKVLHESDLVRNLLLGGIADEDERVDAYEKYWRPVEEANGSGDAATLEAFLRRFLDAQQEEQASASTPPKDDSKTTKPSSPRQGSASLLEGFGRLVRERGGNAGATGLYDAGSEAASSAPVVESAAAGKAVLTLLEELRRAAAGPGAVHAS